MDGKGHGPILVVEDHEDIRDYLAFLIRHEGYEVVTAADGQEALDYLRRGEPPCVVLLDLLLPIKSGFDFREEQMQDTVLAAIPVVALSSDDTLRARARAVGISHFLEKPVLREKLLETLDRFC
ncbi:MAG TPA: response regulator [Candidatus Binatia bacterium]|nr:response regulator [Candidatus Binatia bacterium]